MKEVVDYCNDNNIVLVSDECYSEIYFSENPHSILEIKGSEDCAIAVNSFSKRSRMTCYAVGFVATRNQDLLKAYQAVEQKTQQGIPTFIQDACIAALKDEAHVQEMIDIYSKRMDALIPALNDADFKASKPDGTFYIWARVPKGKTPLETSQWLLSEKGINCTPGNLISNEFNGVNPGAEFVRFAMVPSLEKTVEAAERLRKR
jgi:aspartate/methionine/tyrosine aminotransferase